MGDNEFSRIKIGVGEKPEGYDLADHVLGRFGKEEKDIMDEAYKKCVKAIALLIEDEKQAMNIYNKRV